MAPPAKTKSLEPASPTDEPFPLKTVTSIGRSKQSDDVGRDASNAQTDKQATNQMDAKTLKTTGWF